LVNFAVKKIGTLSFPPTVQYIIAFIVCFLLGFLIMKLIERLIREGLEAANLDIFDKVLGLALGIAEGLAFVALSLVVIEIQPFFEVSTLLSESLFATTILPIIGPAIHETLKPALNGSGFNLNLQDILKKKN
jgi:uncharacterized membrane protein required for colicin V production